MIDPIRELYLWAKWRASIEGRALPLEPSPGNTPVRSGRSDYVDGRHEELALALRARDTLLVLRSQGETGKRHAALLEETYVRRSPEALKATVGGDSHNAAPFFAGLVMSSEKVRRRHRQVGGLDRESVTRRGEKALRDALDAYLLVRSPAFRLAL